MFVTLGTSMWKITPPRPVRQETYVDDRVLASRIVVVAERGAGFTTKQLGTAVVFILETTFYAEDPTSFLVRLPVVKISDDVEPRRMLALLQPFIDLGGAALNTSIALNTTASSDNATSPSTSRFNATSLGDNLQFKLLVTRKGRALTVTQVGSLLYSSIIHMAWVQANPDRALSDVYRASDDCGTTAREGVHIKVCFEALNQQGRRATFSDLEAVFRELMLDPVVADEPESFEASAYLLNNHGRRLARRFLRVIVTKVSDLGPGEQVGTFQIPNDTVPGSIGQDRFQSLVQVS